MRTLRPSRADALLALAVLALALAECLLNSAVRPQAAALATEIPAALALGWRRRLPLASVAVVEVALLAELLLGVPESEPIVPVLTLVVTLYSVAANETLRRAVDALAALGVADAIGSAVQRESSANKLGNFAFGLLAGAGAWTAGRIVRARIKRADDFERKVDWLEGERLVAVAEERTRIARELHDEIAHSVSVMVVQAGAAAAVLERDPGRAAEPLHAVQETGRQALVEMGRLVGLLREDGEELGLTPQPGLRDLDALVAQVRDAGLPVELRIEGEQRPVPVGIDLSAYRVVQEALTNALRHAGHAHAEVRLRFGLETLELEVLDDGPGTAESSSGGHGLVGMSERVSVFGGEFVAGPRLEGGFAVRARLPLDRAPA